MEDWRDGKSVLECHLYMFENSVGCDVTFVAGDTKERIAAHKYVLACMSPVFQAMFMGPLASDDPEVSIPDCDPGVFKEFLRYLYSDIVVITENNAFPLLYLGKKYWSTQLVQKITAFVDASLNEKNCLIIYQQANQFDEKELETKALRNVFRFAEQVLKSREFEILPVNILSKILEADDLRVKEEEVLEAVLRWANKKCVELNLDTTPANQRTVLGENIYSVRFPVMDNDYFAEKVLDIGLLTLEESNMVMRNMLSPRGHVELKFKTTPRISRIGICRRFDTRPLSGIWSYTGNTDAINFKVNRDITVMGFEFFGPFDNYKANYVVNYSLIEYDTDTKLVEACDEKLINLGEIAQFEFENPVFVQGGKMYTLSLNAKGPRSRVFDSKTGKVKVTVDDIVFEFFNSNMSSNGTMTNRGQIPGILFLHR